MKTPNDDENEEDMNENDRNQLIKLKNNLGFMCKWKKESILHVTSFKQHKEPEKYYHSHLILYLPWCNEDQLLGGGTTYQDYYEHVQDIVEHNAQNFHLQNDQLDAAINDIADNGPPQIAWDSIAPTIEQNNNNSTENDIVTICNIDSDEDNDNTPPDLDGNSPGQHNINDSRKNKMSRLFEREACKDIMCNSDYHKHLRNLNDGQCTIVMSNRLWCKTYVHKLREGKVHKGYTWYLGGPGGVGKSHVIQLIRWDMIYFLQQTMNVQPDEPLVLLTAPTGLAAFNIGGITLHSAFMLHCSNNSDVTDFEKRSTMHLKLKNVMLCVIDEISMVGLPRFNQICDTLKKIKQNSEDWGGICILAAGDFYQLPPVGNLQFTCVHVKYFVQLTWPHSYGMILRFMN